MSKFLKPSSISLYLLTVLACFVLGASIAAAFGRAEGQGLAAGAIIFGYGIAGAAVGLLVSILVVGRYAGTSLIKWLNWFLFLVSVVIVVVLVIRVNKALEGSEPMEPGRRPSQTIPSVFEQGFFLISQTQEPSTPMEMGVFAPFFQEGQRLFFYAYSNVGKSIEEYPKADSVTFGRTPHGTWDISYAPPWLNPRHLKLDYDIIYFTVKTLGRDFVEIVVNEETQQTAIASRFAGDLLLWPEFILGVFDVEFREDVDQGIYFKPLDHASLVTIQYRFLSPVAVQGTWLKVRLLDEELNQNAEGWIKWTDRSRLFVRYNLLS